MYSLIHQGYAASGGEFDPKEIKDELGSITDITAVRYNLAGEWFDTNLTTNIE
jgi:hypothetical protein